MLQLVSPHIRDPDRLPADGIHQDMDWAPGDQGLLPHQVQQRVIAAVSHHEVHQHWPLGIYQREKTQPILNWTGFIPRCDLRNQDCSTWAFPNGLHWESSHVDLGVNSTTIETARVCSHVASWWYGGAADVQSEVPDEVNVDDMRAPFRSKE